MRKSLGRKIILYIVPLLGALFFRLWFSTCRMRSHNIERFLEVEKRGQPVIGTCWHYCSLGIIRIFKDYRAAMMVSASADGDFLAGMLERLGFTTVRGSSNRGGARAAKKMIRELQSGLNGGIIADGSQGPARVAQSGAVLLAAKSGGAIVPVGFSVSRYFAFNTWDRLVLPKPFSTIDVFYGEPIEVSENADKHEILEARQRLDDALNEIYNESWQVYDKQEH